MQIIQTELASLNPFGSDGLKNYGRKKFFRIPKYRDKGISCVNCVDVTTSDEFCEKSM
jgi:hypothetical protein